MPREPPVTSATYAHRLHRHGPRVEPKLGQHRRVCQRGRHDGNVDAPRLELVVERFPETVDKLTQLCKRGRSAPPR